MVDMTGANPAELPRTPDDEERDDALEEQSKHSDRMVAAGVCMALSGALAGAGYQWGQWWLFGFGLIALALLTGLYNDSRGHWSTARARLTTIKSKRLPKLVQAASVPSAYNVPRGDR